MFVARIGVAMGIVGNCSIRVDRTTHTINETIFVDGECVRRVEKLQRSNAGEIYCLSVKLRLFYNFLFVFLFDRFCLVLKRLLFND